MRRRRYSWDTTDVEWVFIEPCCRCPECLSERNASVGEADRECLRPRGRPGVADWPQRSRRA